ncbi:glycine oxidase ThiO [Jeotgalibacillus proteolyticus]|uniref:glycine oxidase ThiO n=1 Tax=Jeotgalibacillus proteolyticus TaxID=2082395 RepID=UPI003CF5C2E3
MIKPDVTIVGAGVIGGSIAYELSKRGAKVCLVDQGEAGQKASKAAAGMLGAQAEMNLDSPLYSFAQYSKAMFDGLKEELQECTGIDIELVQKGMIKLARNPVEQKHLKDRAFQLQEANGPSFWLEEKEIQDREPAIQTGGLGGLWIPGDGHVNPAALSTAFVHGAISNGAKLLEYTQVYSLIVENGKVNGVMTSAGPIKSNHVMVAGGAWSEELLQNTGIELNTYPVKGECFSVLAKQQLLQSTLFTEGCYIVPKKAGRLLIGATETPHSFNERVQVKGIMGLMEKAAGLLPALKEASFEKSWAGIRPQTADGLPYMSRHRELDHVWIATGHYRNGILLSAGTSVYMADLLEGRKVREDWLQTFSMERQISYAGRE